MVSLAKATTRNYAVNSNNIYVPLAEHLPAAAQVGSADLTTVLERVYGKIFLTNPGDSARGAKAGDLWYDTSTVNGVQQHVLKYYNGTSWEVIFNGNISPVYHSGQKNSGEDAESAAKRILAADEGGIGDIVIVYWGTAPNIEYESYICTGRTESDPLTAANYTVAHMTTEKGSEVTYDVGSGVSTTFTTPGSSVTEAIVALDYFLGKTAPYHYESLVLDPGNEVLPDFDRYFQVNEYTTGHLKMVCAIRCSDYVSLGVITCTMIEGVIQSDSFSLTDYYVKTITQGHPAASDIDIFNLDFTVESGAFKVKVPSTGVTIPQDCVVSVIVYDLTSMLVVFQ